MTVTTRTLAAQSLQHEDRDLPCCQRLQLGVVGISFSSPLPPLFSLGPINLACRQLEHLVAVLHRDLRVGPKVVDPGGVLGAPSDGTDHGVTTVLLHPHQ